MVPKEQGGRNAFPQYDEGDAERPEAADGEASAPTSSVVSENHQRGPPATPRAVGFVPNLLKWKWPGSPGHFVFFCETSS